MSADARPCDVALVGLGRRGWAHFEMLLSLPGRIRLAGVCDRDPERLREARAFAGPDLRAVSRVEDLVGEGRPDYAVVCTLQDTLPDVATRLLEAGVSVLAEVPPAYDGPTIRRMIDVAAGNGLAIGSAENYPRTPIERLKQRLLRSGALGEIERAEIHGSVGHKGHEIALARHYLGPEANPVRGRATASDGAGLFSGEGVKIPNELTGTVEFDGGTTAGFGLHSVRATSEADLEQADLRSDFAASGGGCRQNQLYLLREGREQPLTLDRRTTEVDGVAVPESLRVEEIPDVVWSNPFADRAFPPASRRPYLCRVDDAPQSWEIAMADNYVDMAEAVRTGRRPDYDVGHSLRDVRIRLMMLESSRRGGAWVDWQEEPFPIEREIIQRGWLRWMMRQSWMHRALDLRRRLLGRAA